MRILTRYILKEHLLPFLYGLLILVFLLFTNFFLRAVDRFLGKGLPLSVVLEYLGLNTAWILALASPMAVLVATLMAFGRLSEDNEIMALKGSGASFAKILMPALAFSITVAAVLSYFNNTVLPSMNHKARLLSRDIYRKRPDLNVEAGYFIDDLPQYSFIVKGKRGNLYQNVRIYGKDRRSTQTSIHAKEGAFSTIEDAILITLYDGEIHELDVKNYQNYRRISFERHRITVPADDLSLQRRDTASRGDREMTIRMMKEKIRDYKERIERVQKRIRIQLERQVPDVTLPENFERASNLLERYTEVLASDSTLTMESLGKRQQALGTLAQRLRADYQMLEGYKRSVNRYRVEIHKKFSLPVACIAFVLVGAPLGITARKGGFIIAVAISFGFFLIYWVFLIAGEELADRNLFSPVLAMWSPNLVLALTGIYFSYRMSRERRAIRLPWATKLQQKPTAPDIVDESF